MGLTIHYSLTAHGNNANAQNLINQLYQAAKDLPFNGLGPVVELSGDQCNYSKRDRDDPLRWLLIQSEAKIELSAVEEGPGLQGIQLHRIRPTHLIAFTAWPGQGCEESNFGLCQYPSEIETETGRRKTGVSGWCWNSFCKTQYAAAPDCGGVPNFLQCHLAVIALLDKAKELGCLDAVDDEGGFWEGRDVQGLVQHVGAWNEMLAALCGRLKDLAGVRRGALEAPIAQYPNFEHLEAAGEGCLDPEFAKLAKLIGRVGRPSHPES